MELPQAGTVHFGEIAHVIAASAEGPRGDTRASPEELGAWSNLVLLCANCHTTIDRAPEDFDEQLLVQWKTSHVSKIETALGISAFSNRGTARVAIEVLQAENRTIHARRGPDNDYRFDPESEYASLWKQDVVNVIIPNHRTILRYLDANRSLLNAEEKSVVEVYRIHVRDLERRHVHGDQGFISERYPAEMDSVYAD
ncbi:hypothetical protein [Agreia sp. Leaf244]|uniref:hypothetical protein n=1 Tax=Agreia sp. Leaf244 TaxID=1736305 RepID=UPI0012FAC5EB|nr:hypothetical protein [Agreia sp. Leaf244]